MTIKVLIVEDNKDTIYAIKRTLKSLDEDYEVKAAENAKQCMKILEKMKPDIILMDIMMPGKDGMQLSIDLKENKKTRDIPILFVTAKVDKVTKKAGGIIGQDYIEKPFDPNDLDKSIKKQLYEIR